MREIEAIIPDREKCPHCAVGPITGSNLNDAFVTAQKAAIQEFLKHEPVKGHTNGCILWRMVCSGIHPDIAFAVMDAKVKSAPRIIRPGEVVN